MDKYEYKVRAEEIRQLIAEGNYALAAEMADSIDWRRVKSVMMLCTVSDLYKINRRYEDARDMLLLAYDKRPGSRTICYSLCELCLKTGDYVQAVEYYKEFVQVAPKDPGKYILQYKIYESQDVGLEERIQVLEELKQTDYREKWAYELAYLYHRMGLASRCVEECDELILWFGTGKYVIKAMELKMLHEPLTAEQQEAYDHRFDPQEPEASVVEEPVAEEPAPNASQMNVVLPEVSGETRVFDPQDVARAAKTETEPEEEMDIHVKTVDVGEYNTINLQAELAAGLAELLDEPVEETVAEKETIAEEEAGVEEEAIPEEEAIAVEETPVEEEAFAEEEILAEESAEEDTEAPYVEEPVSEEPVPVGVEERMAQVLSQDSDGQISLHVPEEQKVERQITGQMNIEDILVEWERMKKENQERHEEQLRKQVLQQTGEMFTAFEASIRDGLLEQLEKEDAEEDASEYAEPETESTADLETENEETDEVEELVEVEKPVEAEEPDEVEELVEVEETVEAEESAEDIVLAGEDADGTEEAVSEEKAVAEEEALASEEPEEISEEVTEETTNAPEPPQNQANVRELTPEEKELYAPYIYTKSAREQLVKALDSISMAPYTGNLIITGEEGMDTLTLAKSIVNEVQQIDSNFSGRVAKISGQTLNHKDVADILGQIKNGSLIIEHVSQVNEDTVKKLYKGLQQENQGMILVILDTKKNMRSFLQNNAKFASAFTASIDVEPLSDDILVAIARKYARSKEFSIDDFGMLALHRRIDERQTSDHVVTANEVKEIVDEAIHHAKRKTLGHFADVLFGKRYDEEDMIILGEKDFV